MIVFRNGSKAYCDAVTWQVISNSLDIDFIHGDIHGRSCKKEQSSKPAFQYAWLKLGTLPGELTVTKGHVSVNAW